MDFCLKYGSHTDQSGKQAIWEKRWLITMELPNCSSHTIAKVKTYCNRLEIVLQSFNFIMKNNIIQLTDESNQVQAAQPKKVVKSNRKIHSVQHLENESRRHEIYLNRIKSFIATNGVNSKAPKRLEPNTIS